MTELFDRACMYFARFVTDKEVPQSIELERGRRHWEEVARLVIADRARHERLKDGAAKAMVIAAMDAEDRGASTSAICDALEATYFAYTISSSQYGVSYSHWGVFGSTTHALYGDTVR